MRIVRLTAENIKCLAAVTIEPDPNESVVTVGGLNGAGKSTALDSIEYALGGVRGIPAVPIRTGETKARIVLDLDAEGDFSALRVERRFSVKGGSELIVTSGGERVSSPQALIDSLEGRVGFDPLAFTREKPAEQRRILQGLVGLDFTEADKRRATVFDHRTAENRTVRELKGQLTGMEVFDGAPAEETSAVAVSGEIQAACQTNADNAEQRRAAMAACDEEHGEKETLDTLVSHFGEEQERQRLVIVGLTEHLATEQKALAAMRDDHEKRTIAQQATLNEAKSEAQLIARTAADLTDQPTDALQEQLEKCEETNRQVRANAAAKDVTAKLADRVKAVDFLTSEIERIDEAKQAKMEAAKWPVDGLGFSDEGVTFKGLPFEQASQAEKIDVSTAMGFAENPTLRVMLIRDGSLLDDDSLARIAKLAAEKDGQVWLERVGEGDCSVIIRDGAILEEDKNT